MSKGFNERQQLQSQKAHLESMGGEGVRSSLTLVFISESEKIARRTFLGRLSWP